MELTASLISATVLTLGRASAVGLSTRSFQLIDRKTSSLALPGSLPSLIRQDFADARHITPVSGGGLTIVVPDRDGNLTDETIDYQLVDRTLQRQENGGDTVDVASGIERIAVQQDVRTIDGGGSPPAVPPRVKLETRKVFPFNNSATSIIVESLDGSQVGDLWIVAVAVDGNELGDLEISESGWTPLHQLQRSGNLTLAVWSRIVDGSETPSRTIEWDDARSGIAWMIAFSGAAASPIYHHQATSGSYASWLLLWGITGPSVPQSYVPQDSMILQFAVTEENRLHWMTSGLNNYVTEFVQSAPTNAAATIEASCSYKTFDAPGFSDNTNRYHFYGSCNFILSTIVITAGTGS